MTFSIITLSIKGLYVALSINNTQHTNPLQYADSHYAECRVLFVVMLCRSAACHFAECRYAECRYTECRGAGWKDLPGTNTLA
jgi:hypothetical protein